MIAWLMKRIRSLWPIFFVHSYVHPAETRPVILPLISLLDIPNFIFTKFPQVKGIAIIEVPERNTLFIIIPELDPFIKDRISRTLSEALSGKVIINVSMGELISSTRMGL